MHSEGGGGSEKAVGTLSCATMTGQVGVPSAGLSAFDARKCPMHTTICKDAIMQAAHRCLAGISLADDCSHKQIRSPHAIHSLCTLFRAVLCLFISVIVCARNINALHDDEAASSTFDYCRERIRTTILPVLDGARCRKSEYFRYGLFIHLYTNFTHSSVFCTAFWG